jgi:aminoglycoside phosphotransferase (APT) family kinase protein
MDLFERSTTAYISPHRQLDLSAFSSSDNSISYFTTSTSVWDNVKPLTTARSATMPRSTTARSTNSNAGSITVSITSQVPVEIRRSALHAIEKMLQKWFPNPRSVEQYDLKDLDATSGPSTPSLPKAAARIDTDSAVTLSNSIFPSPRSHTTSSSPTASTAPHPFLHLDLDISPVADGGYNDIWLVQFPDVPEIQYLKSNNSAELSAIPSRFVFRTPKSNTLFPYQLRNEVAFLTFISTKYPKIPVPKVYDFSEDPANPYISMEYIEGKPLYEEWPSLNHDQKDILTRKIATLNLDLLEIRSPGIGGLDPTDHQLAPPVEGTKLFGSRHMFHSPQYYPIGPYSSTKEYALAYYQKETVYYSQVSMSTINQEFFEKTSLPDFLETVRKERDEIAADLLAFQPEEPYALIHGDLAPRNIMVRGTEIVAILDWEFAGFFPLSVSPEPVIMDMEHDHEWDEFRRWSDRMRELSEDIARERAWPENEIELLISYGDPKLNMARNCMIPRDTEDTDESSDHEDDCSEDDATELRKVRNASSLWGILDSNSSDSTSKF